MDGNNRVGAYDSEGTVGGATAWERWNDTITHIENIVIGSVVANFMASFAGQVVHFSDNHLSELHPPPTGRIIRWLSLHSSGIVLQWRHSAETAQQ